MCYWCYCLGYCYSHSTSCIFALYLSLLVYATFSTYEMSQMSANRRWIPRWGWISHSYVYHIVYSGYIATWKLNWWKPLFTLLHTRHRRRFSQIHSSNFSRITKRLLGKEPTLSWFLAFLQIIMEHGRGRIQSSTEGLLAEISNSGRGSSRQIIKLRMWHCPQCFLLLPAIPYRI